MFFLGVNIEMDDFGLVYNPGDVKRNAGEFSKLTKHMSRYLGKKISINNAVRPAMGGLRGKRGRITGIVVVNNQMAGVEARLFHDKSTQILRKHEIYLEGYDQLIEDNHIYAWQTMRVEDALRHWRVQRTYRIGDWAGLEKLYWQLTHVENEAYLVPQNASRGMLNWQIILPEQEFSRIDSLRTSTVITCNVMVFERSWTISISLSESTDVFVPQRAVSHPDPWVRAMLWTAHTLEFLHTDGFQQAYTTRYLEGIKKRIHWSNFIRREMMRAQTTIRDAAIKMDVEKYGVDARTGLPKKQNPQYRPGYAYPYITVCVNAWSLPTHTIGKYGHPLYSETPAGYKRAISDYWEMHGATMRFYGEFTIHESVFNSMVISGQTRRRPEDQHPYYKYVLVHEMIHAIFNEACDGKSHGPRFQQLARAVGLPPKYSD